MLYWAQSDFDARPYEDHSIANEPTRQPLPTPTSPADLVAQFFATIDPLRIRHDARNARRVA